jgi:hypothetical protein
MRRWLIEVLEEDPEDAPDSAVEEVESEARARRCPCGNLVRYLRALHGKRHCSGKCAARYE